MIWIEATFMPDAGSAEAFTQGNKGWAFLETAYTDDLRLTGRFAQYNKMDSD